MPNAESHVKILQELEGKLADLERRSGIVKDIEEIKQLKWKYFYLMDDAIRGQNINLFKDITDLFVPDDLKPKAKSSLHGQFTGVNEITDFFKSFTSIANFSVQTGANPIVKVNGDMATGIFYMTASLTMKEGNQATWICILYNDLFKKIDGKWYFKETKADYVYWSPFDKGWQKQWYVFEPQKAAR